MNVSSDRIYGRYVLWSVIGKMAAVELRSVLSHPSLLHVRRVRPNILWGDEFCTQPSKRAQHWCCNPFAKQKNKKHRFDQKLIKIYFFKNVCTIVIHYVKLSNIGNPKHPQSQWVPQNPLFDATSVPSLGSGSWRKLGGSPAQYILRWFSININIYIYIYFFIIICLIYYHITNLDYYYIFLNILLYIKICIKYHYISINILFCM